MPDGHFILSGLDLAFGRSGPGCSGTMARQDTPSKVVVGRPRPTAGSVSIAATVGVLRQARAGETIADLFGAAARW